MYHLSMRPVSFCFLCHKDVNYKIHCLWKEHYPLFKNTSASLVDFKQLQTHIHLFHFKRSWYRMMYISVSGYKSCCQSQLLLSVYVLWKWNGYLSRSPLLHWLYTLLRSFEVISFPYCGAYFKYTDRNKRGPAGVASIFWYSPRPHRLLTL